MQLIHMNKIDSFEKLLEDFNELHIKNSQPEPTFMQVSGYPGYENVCSNLLGFFFDAEEIHGFKDLFVRSLLECVSQDVGLSAYRTENVEREFKTKNNNRIDLVIETEAFVIGIENKVFSGVQNDLHDYEACIAESAREKEKEPVYILLSLKGNGKATNGTAFVNVTYSKFIGRLKKNLGLYLLDANSKWILFFNDFMKTLEDLQGETKLNKELIEFYNKHYDDIINLLGALADLDKSIKDKANKIKTLVSADTDYPVNQYIYNSKDHLFTEYYVEFNDSKQITGQIVLDVWIEPSGCDIIAGVRGDNSVQKAQLEKYLTKHKVNYHKWSYDDVYMQLGETYSIFESEEKIAEKFTELLELILKS